MGPHISSAKLGLVILWHEAVGHRELRELLGGRGLRDLCLKVFESMSHQEREREFREAFREIGQSGREKVFGVTKNLPTSFRELERDPVMLAAFLSNEDVRARVAKNNSRTADTSGWEQSPSIFCRSGVIGWQS